MSKQKKSEPAGDDELGERRSETDFQRTSSFDQSLEGLPRVAILARVGHFEHCWKGSRSIADMPRGFDYKSIYLEKGKYLVSQFDAGRDHRVCVVFLQIGSQAYYVHAFRKTKQRNQAHITAAKALAKDLWEALKKEEDDATK